MNLLNKLLKIIPTKMNTSTVKNPDEVVANAIGSITGEAMKYCPTCKTYKPVSEFHKNKATKDGLQGECKKCRAARDYKRTKRYAKEVSVPEPAPTPVPVNPNREIIKTIDGRTLVKRDAIEDPNPLSKFTSRELFAELKRREYVWPDGTIYKKQYVDYNNI